MSDDTLVINSPRDFADAVQWVLDEAVSQRSRRLLLSDPDFCAWPLNAEPVRTALTAFARMPGRQVIMIASRFDRVQPQHPRFFAWYRVWGHTVTALAPVEAGADIPCLAAADRHHGLLLTDPQNSLGRRMVQDPALRRAVDELDALAQRCERSLPATTLGL